MRKDDDAKLTRDFPNSREAQDFIIEMLPKGYRLVGEPTPHGSIIRVTMVKS